MGSFYSVEMFSSRVVPLGVYQDTPKDHHEALKSKVKFNFFKEKPTLIRAKISDEHGCAIGFLNSRESFEKFIS